jgi:hypothetical protein
LEFAPFVSAAYRTQAGLGVQGRAWWYDDSETLTEVNDGTVTISSAAPLGLGIESEDLDDVNTFESSLDIDVMDLLVTYRAQSCWGSVELGAGARYTRIQQAYSAILVPAADDLEVVESGHSFEGLGPSLFLEGRLAATRQLSFFATVRYSFLFGQSEQEATLITDNVLAAERFQENDDLLSIAEFDLGAEYALRLGSAELFVKAAFVSQVWEGAGNSANNDIIAVLDDEEPEVSDKNADLGLWGFRTEAGVRF